MTWERVVGREGREVGGGQGSQTAWRGRRRASAPDDALKEEGTRTRDRVIGPLADASRATSPAVRSSSYLLRILSKRPLACIGILISALQEASAGFMRMPTGVTAPSSGGPVE
jgi:hypothetical protein